MLDHDRLFIGGDWVTPAGTDRITVIEAATEEPLGTVPDGTTADIDHAVAAARATFDKTEWSRTDPVERGELLERVAAGIAARGAEIAELISRENGSTVLFS